MRRFEEEASGSFAGNGEDSAVVRAKRKRRSYEKYFEGYTLRELSGGDGKEAKLVRVYEGDRYHQTVRRLSPVGLRVCYGAMFLTAAAVFVWSLCLDVPSNSSWIVMIPVWLTIVCFGACALALLEYLPSGQDLKVTEYRSGAKALLRDTACAAVGIAAQALFIGGLAAFSPETRRTAELFHIALLLVSGGLMFGIHCLERSVVYTVISGKACMDSNVIEN